MAVDWLQLFLDEDVGPGDVTADAIFGADEDGVGRIVARERCLLAGMHHVGAVFSRLGGHVEAHMNDGSWVEEGTSVATVSGPIRAILTGERVALNILARMSGIATETRRLMEDLATACSPAVVAGTRKTTPGFRSFEKQAIRIAGGDPHRMGLWDEAMVKDNHAAAAGGLGPAVAKVRERHAELTITAEAESLEDALAAAKAGADWILIDNQDPITGAEWAKALAGAHPTVRIEASGGIDPGRVADYGWADRISLGALTTRARSIDFSMELSGGT